MMSQEMRLDHWKSI